MGVVLVAVPALICYLAAAPLGIWLVGTTPGLGLFFLALNGERALPRGRDNGAFLLDSLREAVLAVDQNGILEWSNAAARELLHLKAGAGAGATGTTTNLPAHIRSELADSGPLADAIQAGLETLEKQPGTKARHQIDLVRLGRREFTLQFLPAPSNSTAIIFTEVTLQNHITELKDGFLSCVSHELRTPLTNICASVEILQDMPPTNKSETQEFLKIVTKESTHLAQVVEDIMDITLLEADHALLESDRVNVATILHAAKAATKERATEAGLDVRVQMEDENLFCLGDRRRLEQAVHKLLDNAMKFTPAGGSVRLGAHRPQPSRIRVTIDDSGFGVPKPQRRTVFDKFQQRAHGLTDKPEGTGLGLPLCKLLVECMGGTIWCEESDLGGARFCFELPATELVSA
jgi:signal transduction histidine kinase